MRTMQHNSRTNSTGSVHGSKHNDRNFDVSRADNIDPTRADLNIYENVYNDPNMTFAEVELRFYQEHFGDQLERTNERYRKNGHPERCKDMADWMKAKRNAPEETVMQIGSIEAAVSREQLWECYQDYQQRLERWNQDHGCPMTILDTALHCDEAVPHVQSRRVWHYQDADGALHIGQEKALEAAGVPLPDPSKTPGRHNNRKQTFDMIARSMWLDVIQEHHIDVERDPVPGARHNLEKVDMLREKSKTLLTQTAQQETELLIYQQKAQEASRTLKSVQARIEDLQSEYGALKPSESLQGLNPKRNRLRKTITLSQDEYAAMYDLAKTAGIARYQAQELTQQVDRLQEQVEEQDRQIEQLHEQLPSKATLDKLDHLAELEKAVSELLHLALDKLLELWERLVEPLRAIGGDILTFRAAYKYAAAHEPAAAKEIAQELPEIDRLVDALGGETPAMKALYRAKGMEFSLKVRLALADDRLDRMSPSKAKNNALER